MVNSSTDKVKYSITNYSFIATSLVLLLILFIRVTRGLDLTDEMQYYGEIKGLIETGRLFSNDLFIQQSVYILFYPAFYIYHSLFGFEGLVFFGRLLMATLSIAVFLYAYRKFLEFNFSASVASLAALSLTFAIPYHGVFAPSYNTISQVMWIIFAIRFFEWKQRSPMSWAAIPVITAFAHPTSAVMMSLLVLIRLTLERDFKQAAKVILALLVGVLLALPIILNFGTLQEYLNSLTFSSGYGVGETFISSKIGPITLLEIFVMFGGGLLFWEHLKRINSALFANLLITFAILLFSVGWIEGAYTYRMVLVLASLSAFFYAWAISNFSDGHPAQIARIHWLVVLLLAYTTTLGVTSGNGIAQATGAFMVGLPLLLAIAVNYESSKEIVGKSLIKIVCAFLLLILVSVQWSLYPYREAGWWKVNQPIQSVSEFKFISTSQERAIFIQRIKNDLDSIVQGKKALIVSEYPGLYFAFGAHIETCMLYMHSLTSDKSERVLMECLSNKNPEIVVDIYASNNIAHWDSRIKVGMRNYYEQQGFNCQEKSISFDSDGKLNPNLLKYRVCKRITR
jgi:hypothetical protein